MISLLILNLENILTCLNILANLSGDIDEGLSKVVEFELIAIEYFIVLGSMNKLFMKITNYEK